MCHAIMHEAMPAQISGRPLRQSVIASFLRVLLMSELFLTLALAAAVAQAPFHQKAVFEQRPAVTIANGKLELTINERGGAFVNLVLLDDAERLSPLWNPVRHAREAGEANQFGGGVWPFRLRGRLRLGLSGGAGRGTARTRRSVRAAMANRPVGKGRAHRSHHVSYASAARARELYAHVADGGWRKRDLRGKLAGERVGVRPAH